MFEVASLEVSDFVSGRPGSILKLVAILAVFIVVAGFVLFLKDDLGNDR